MKISELAVKPNWILSIATEDGRTGEFDVSPYLQYEVFEPLKDPAEFANVFNCKYFVGWECGADLSADTIESGLSKKTA